MIYGRNDVNSWNGSNCVSPVEMRVYLLWLCFKVFSVCLVVNHRIHQEATGSRVASIRVSRVIPRSFQSWKKFENRIVKELSRLVSHRELNVFLLLLSDLRHVCWKSEFKRSAHIYSLKIWAWGVYSSRFWSSEPPKVWNISAATLNPAVWITNKFTLWWIFVCVCLDTSKSGAVKRSFRTAPHFSVSRHSKSKNLERIRKAEEKQTNSNLKQYPGNSKQSSLTF